MSVESSRDSSTTDTPEKSSAAVPSTDASVISFTAEGVPIEVTPRVQLFYAPWLIWQIVKANVDVARRILDPRLPIRPHVIRIRAGQKTDLGRVIYANSITLTPGTVTIDLEGRDLRVHALTDEAAEGLATGEMDRRVSSTEESV